MTINFIKTLNSSHANLFICLAKAELHNDLYKKLDDELGGILSKALSVNPWFKAKLGEHIAVICPDSRFSYVVLVGASDVCDVKSARKLGGKISLFSKNLKLDQITILSEGTFPKPSEDELVSNVALGFMLKSWKFDKYKTDNAKKSNIINAEIVASQVAQKIYDEVLEPTYCGIIKARELINEPANVITPESFAEHALDMSSLGLDVEVLSKNDLEKLGMNALLGVAQGSVNEPKVVVLKWFGGDKNAPCSAFVGKGLTFDSGGISIKPSRNMDQMKSDMSGGATVLGTMIGLAKSKAKVNAVGVIGLAENMPSGHAQRPGDIVKTMSGKTVEILDTDAEGRLVLADVLWYTSTHFNPKLIVDFATLTGAIQIALGTEFAGVFSNDTKLKDRLVSSGERVDEMLWHMPLTKGFDKQINSEIADIKNLGSPGKGGSSTAAHFLQRFIANDIPWAHIDIAGVAYCDSATDLSQKGGVGFGVQLLMDFLLNSDENLNEK